MRCMQRAAIVVAETVLRENIMDNVKCESCGDREANVFSCNPHDGEWTFTCSSCEVQDYWIDIDDFFKNKFMAAQWMNHLNEKRWMNPQSFFDMMSRLYGQMREVKQ